jgi:hypothetical protein
MPLAVEGPAAKPKSIEPDLQQLLGAPPAQVTLASTLDHG